MKNIKAILLIILGSFFLATGFAFAGGAELQLRGGPSFDGSTRGTGTMPAMKADDPAGVTKADVVPDPKPTMGQKVKKWVGENKTKIFMGGVAAYIGFALVGTLFGAFTFGLGALLILALAAA